MGFGLPLRDCDTNNDTYCQRLNVGQHKVMRRALLQLRVSCATRAAALPETSTAAITTAHRCFRCSRTRLGHRLEGGVSEPPGGSGFEPCDPVRSPAMYSFFPSEFRSYLGYKTILQRVA